MKWLIVMGFFFLQACSNLPTNIKNPPVANVQLHQVLENNSSFDNSPVRWGGTIIDVENEAELSKMQILFYPLNYYGRPVLKQAAFGRFVTTSKQFFDPEVFSVGTEVTIAGKVQGAIDKKIGEKIIKLPVIALENHHVWPSYSNRSYGDYYAYNNYNSGYYGFSSRYTPYRYFRGGYRSFYGCY